jgi:hypothetical protein
MVIAMFGVAIVGGWAVEKTGVDEVTESLSPLQAPLQSMTGDELFARLLEHNRLREVRLQRYSAIRSYDVANDSGKVCAEELVREEYRAPDHKTFVTKSEKGSTLVRDLVLDRLIASESEASSGRAHRDSSIKPANYEFNLLGEQDVGPYHCVVVEARPKRKNKYLFEGKVWIDADDYAIVRIAGQPAKSLSFWITRADFVRQYQKIGNFWLPAKDETFVHMRLYGKKMLTIDHMDYAINEGAGGSAQDGTTENRTNER